MAPSVQEQIEMTMGSVPQVESVYLVPTETHGTIRVLTIVDVEDDDVYSLIYAKEVDFARVLRPRRLDFTVIARYGRPVQELVGATRPSWERAPGDGKSH